MTTARFTVPKQRLTGLLRTPGGPPAAEALAAAQANLETLRPDCISELKQILERAEAVFATLDPGEPEAGLAELYATAVRGVGLGEVCGEGAVDTALHSLCDLIDSFRTQGRYDAQAIAVHLNGWRLLVMGSVPAEGVATLVSGLTKVSAHYAPSEEG